LLQLRGFYELTTGEREVQADKDLIDGDQFIAFDSNESSSFSLSHKSIAFPFQAWVNGSSRSRRRRRRRPGSRRARGIIGREWADRSRWRVKWKISVSEVHFDQILGFPRQTFPFSNPPPIRKFNWENVPAKSSIPLLLLKLPTKQISSTEDE